MNYAPWTRLQLKQLAVDVFSIATVVGVSVGWIIILVRIAIRLAP